MLKPKKALQNLSNDCKDNLYKYSQHRKELDNICLADFCFLYIKKFEDAEKKENSDNDAVDKLQQ